MQCLFHQHLSKIMTFSGASSPSHRTGTKQFWLKKYLSYRSLYMHTPLNVPARGNEAAPSILTTAEALTQPGPPVHHFLPRVLMLWVSRQPHLTHPSPFLLWSPSSCTTGCNGNVSLKPTEERQSHLSSVPVPMPICRMFLQPHMPHLILTLL